MFRQLKLYYVLVSLPFVLLLLGSAFFFNAIKSTITRNPHPQINYAIFVIILAGGIFILLNIRRLLHEARTLVDFTGLLRSNADPATLQERADRYTGDLSYLLQMVASSSSRAISHQEQAAIEHELTNARSHLFRRNALPQYLTGLLVGMGLLGTFIGLLATLNDISVLINSFADLDMKTVDPILVFRTMIERMKAPMQSMGIAFSASMFGLLGSIILGLMMVGTRRLQGDIVSLMSSEVARHIETALSFEGKAATGNGGGSLTGDEYKVLVRIDERLAESTRLQQRALTAEIDDFQKQRADMLRTLADQTEANNRLRSELQQLGRQLGDIFTALERGNGDMHAQVSELTVLLASDAKENQKLLGQQLEEQKRLKDTLDSYRIEERLTESARLQQRALVAEIDDFRKQRADMLRLLAEQSEASSQFRSELQELGRRFSEAAATMEKGNCEISAQLSDQTVHLAADAKETQKLLGSMITEQKRLRDSLDLRVKSNT